MHRDINIPRLLAFVIIKYIFHLSSLHETPSLTKDKVNPIKEAKTTANIIFPFKKKEKEKDKMHFTPATAGKYIAAGGSLAPGSYWRQMTTTKC